MDGDVDISPIVFGTDGWRATLATFTKPRVRIVGQAVSSYLADENLAGDVAIGYDSRETSREFAEELARVIASNGRDVTIAKRDCPTPALAWTTATGEFVGGLMITASHNPPSYNGVKFVTADGSPALPAVTDAIEARLAPPDTADEYGSITEADLIEPYVSHIESFVETDLEELVVAYDAFHGSGRGVTDRVLENAGATVTRFRSERDVEFGGIAPEPEPETAQQIRDAVTEGEADIGLINDGDADRVGIVTPIHGYLDPNILLAALYELLLESGSGGVVRTVSTSSLVDRVATAHDEEVYETAVGFKWVAAALIEHEALVGGEESGGFGVRSHLPNKDGILVGLLVCAAHIDRSLDDRIDALFSKHGEIHQDRTSLNCSNDRKQTVLESLEQELPDTIAGVPVDRINTVDGFKIQLQDGTWILIRPSGTEPKMRVYAEALSAGRVRELVTAGKELVDPLVDG